MGTSLNRCGNLQRTQFQEITYICHLKSPVKLHLKYRGKTDLLTNSQCLKSNSLFFYTINLNIYPLADLTQNIGCYIAGWYGTYYANRASVSEV